MKIYLAATTGKELALITEPAYILESYAYISKHTNDLPLLLRNKVMMDSGAFTFIGRGEKRQRSINWEVYLEEYAAFVRRHKIKDYLELDIYSVIGKEKTEELRLKLETLIGSPSIPVWHRFLGLQYWYELLEQYKYVAIGASGRYDSAWCRSHPDMIRSLVLVARQQGVRVHGLGYTELKQLNEIPFESVDSTTWVNGGRFGEMHKFNGSKILKMQSASKGLRMKASVTESRAHNFLQWIKYQEWSEKNL